jgi:SAM-dependent methyltransferase
VTQVPAGQQGTGPEGPNIARVYDYILGGSHNFAADRSAAQEFLAIWPEAWQTMRANRAFLGRAVRYLAAEAGISQFLDIGSGIPTVGNVHEVAQKATTAARVVYVDSDEVPVLHSRAILAANDTVTAIQGDLRRPQEILAHPELQDLFDLSQPVAVLLVAVLHFVPVPDAPARLVAELRDALQPRSYLVLSHATADGQPSEVIEAHALYSQTTAPFQFRSHRDPGLFRRLRPSRAWPGAYPSMASRPSGRPWRAFRADPRVRGGGAQAMKLALRPRHQPWLISVPGSGMPAWPSARYHEEP